MDSKLQGLWKIMEEQSIDVLLMQNVDEYQSEDIHASRQRVKWLCGFTGSNAFLVICKGEKGRFFTDNRYTIQSALEVDQEHYEIYDMSNISPLDWIERNVKDNAIIGYDGELFTPKQITRYSSLNLKMLTGVVVDRLWERPMQIPQQIVEHPIEFSGLAGCEKRALVVNEMRGAEALLLTDIEAISWLLNIRNVRFHNNPSVCARAILHRAGRIELFIDSAHQVEISDKDVEVRELKDLTSALTTIGSITVDAATIPMSIFSIIHNKISAILDSDPCTLPKATKNIVEIRGTEKAHIKDGTAIVNFLYWLECQIANDRAVTEIEAALKLLEFRRQQELFKGESFDTISAFGGNGAIVHYRPSYETNSVIRKRGIYLLDSGGQYLDGTTDVTRTIAIGEPSEEQIGHFTAVLRGHIALARVVFRVGTRGSDLDVLARKYLWEKHLNYGHGTGHGVGSFLSVHEGPQAIAQGSYVVILPGMIFSNEPGYYKEGEYGIRIENLMYAEQCDQEFIRFKQLTCVPIDKSLIDTSILSSEEIEYINSYHKFVYEAVSPHVGLEVKKWLLTACAAI